MSQEQGLIIRAPVEIASYEEVRAQAHKLDEFYRKLMILDTDYGIIPGTKKPCLYKSGAELLRLWGGLIPRFEVGREGTDLEKGVYNYEVCCKLFIRLEGEEVYQGEGVGNCNSLETKYRWRWCYENQVPATVDKESLPRKEMPGKGGGHYTLYRLDNENPHDLGNTILKMAKKRAFVDAVLTVTGASRIFTQDLDENDQDEPQARGGKPTVREPKAKRKATTDILKKIKAEAERIGIDPRTEFNSRFENDPTEDQLLEWLKELQATVSPQVNGQDATPTEITTWEEFFPLAKGITGKGEQDILGMLGIQKVEEWNLTLDEALEEIKRLCGGKK